MVSQEREISQYLSGFFSSTYLVVANILIGWGEVSTLKYVLPVFISHCVVDTLLGQYWKFNIPFLIHHFVFAFVSCYMLYRDKFNKEELDLIYWSGILEVSSIFNGLRYFLKGTMWQQKFDILFGLSFIFFRTLFIYKSFFPVYKIQYLSYSVVWLLNLGLNSYWVYGMYRYSKRVKNAFTSLSSFKYIKDKLTIIYTTLPSEHSLRTTAIELTSLKDKCESLIPNIKSTITFALLSMMMTFTIITSLILRKALLMTSQFQLFTFGSISVTSLYFIFNFILNKYIPSYSELDKDKRYYILANMIKSGILAACCPFIGYIFINGLVYNIWDNNFIWNIGCVYTIPDFVSLFMVRRMERSTIIHHVCVCIFNLWSLNNDFNDENVCRGIMVYAVFSTFAYLVNFLLGSRFLIEENMKYYLAKTAMYIYITCCIVNWSWQIYYMYHLVSNVFLGVRLSLIAYVSSIALIVWDDIILIRWLNKTPKIIKKE